MQEQIGRFGHHPDPAIDFCVEVEAIEGMVCDVRAGLETQADLDSRITRAMTFRVGGDQWAVNAKALLRRIEAATRAATKES
jgi:hypothetical protein